MRPGTRAAVRLPGTALLLALVGAVTYPPAAQRAGSGYRDEEWLISARLDAESQTPTINFGMTDEGQVASWTCTGPGYSSTEPVYIDISGDLEELEIPAGGTIVEAGGRDVQQFESIRITVIDNPHER